MGPKKCTPLNVKGGFGAPTREGGRSAIIWTPGFPRNFQHRTQRFSTSLTSSLPRIGQYCCRNEASTAFTPKCFIFSCAHSIKSSVTRDCLGRITGCFESNGRNERSILPPSLMRSSSSRNGVRLYNDEVFGIGFLFDRFSMPYLSAFFRDSTSFPKYLACSLLISHISASRSYSADSGTGHAFLLFFEEEDGVFFYCVCCEMGVVNTRPYVVILEIWNSHQR